MDKSLENRAIDFKGKKYVEVKERIIYFNENYENGRIETSLISDNDEVVIKAIITPDVANPERYFTGHAQEVKGSNYINKTSAMENAETSAVGRAFAMMGIGVIDSIASIDEINKAENRKHLKLEPKETDVFINETHIKNMLDKIKELPNERKEAFFVFIGEKYGANELKDLRVNQYEYLMKHLDKK